MPSLSVSWFSSPNALATIISTLEVLREASDVIVAFPYLGHILGAALGIARTVEKIRGDKERYVRLARRAAELSQHVTESIESDPSSVNENLRRNLKNLQLLLQRIGEDVESHLKRTALSRFLLQASIAQLLEDRMDQLDSAWRAFDVCGEPSRSLYWTLISAETDLRLFRWSDLRCHKVRGTYRLDGIEVGEEWEGRWDGRAIVVRTIRPSAMSQVLLRYRHHPYLAQVVGYSHPSLSEKFYVMDTGTGHPQVRGDGFMLMTSLIRGDTVDYPVSWQRHHFTPHTVASTCKCMDD
ncbi:hypothetical protein OH77DRAFT_1410549 [Trametes cingulata]|nr:hypothetical protein OH77DRAFT_1410549 [Trametes cingulata]